MHLVNAEGLSDRVARALGSAKVLRRLESCLLRKYETVRPSGQLRMLRLSMSENDDHPPLRTETAVSRVGRQRLSACRVRPRERRRHNANPCFAVGPVIQNRSSCQGRSPSSSFLLFLSCTNSIPRLPNLSPFNHHSHGQPSIRRPSSTPPNHSSHRRNFDPRSRL